MSTLGADILDFAVALEDSKKASRVMFKLVGEVAALGGEVEIDMRKAIAAQRLVENEFFEIGNALMQRTQ